jgi:ribonucleoside-diphosphate reductase alpha chain
MSVLSPEWDDNRQVILDDRYALENEENYEDIAKRIDNEVNVDIFEELNNFEFVPAGRMLAGIGTDTTKTFFNCYVIGFRNIDGKGIDSRGAISDLNRRAFEISARGGGFGVNWSPLRPTNSDVSGVNGKSTGPLSFMTALDSLIETVSQGGSRRGAQMYGMEAWHPDIRKFVSAKSDLEKLNNANLSVFVSDKFMQAVKNDDTWELMFPDTDYDGYDEEWDGNIWKWIEEDKPVISYDTISARKLFDLICSYAHDNGEPGLIFLERYNKLNIPCQDERIIATNPCGEQGLSEDAVCNLGAINLTQFVDFDENKVLWEKLKKVVHKSVEFLDEIIDINPYYQTKTKQHQEVFRKIGLGFMGLADYFILRRIKYGSQKSLNELRTIMGYIQQEAFRKSSLLAKEKGAAPIWDDYMLDNRYLIQLDPEVRELIKEYGLRNTRILTVAPTGTTGSLAGVSSGVEPNFAYELERDDRIGKRKDIHWIYPQREELGLDEGLFVESSDLSYKEHIEVQSVVQNYVDSSISKTINAPNEATVEDTKDAFMYAYDLSCKGITYYRDGSRQGVLKKSEEKKEEVSELEKMFKQAGDSVIPNEVKIPKEPPVKLYKRKDNHSKKWYFFIAFADRDCTRPFALFIKTNNYAKGEVRDWIISKMERLLMKKGISEEILDEQSKKYSGQSNVDKIARTIGVALRHNIKIKDVVEVLDSCEPEFSSLLFHIKKLLSNFISDGTVIEYEKCPKCGGKLVYESGCKSCVECFYSGCN